MLDYFRKLNPSKISRYTIFFSDMQFITGKDSQYTEILLPIMLAISLMLSGNYYAQNHASIIGWCLTVKMNKLLSLLGLSCPIAILDCICQYPFASVGILYSY